MAKRKNKKQEKPIHENIVKIEYGDNVQKNMGRYAEAVNLDRAIVDARDGLKPVQRRIIYAGYKEKLFPTNKYVKVAKIGGDVMGNYHPHGDSSINEAIVNMSQDWKERMPLIDIHGSNGDIFGNSAAAPRYIEGRLTKIAMYLMNNYQKSVLMVDNYDNTKKEPVYLPAALPNALINPAQGIGYALATKILPHNPVELLNGAIALLDDPDISDEDLLKIIPGPDFPTYGILIDNKKETVKEEAMKELTEGSGTFTIRGHMHIEKDGKETLLVADEVPYSTNATKIIEQFGKVAKDNPALNVTSVGNESSGDNGDDDQNDKLRLVMRFKNDKLVEDAKSLIWSKTDMETRLTSNNTMIINNRPKQVGTRDFLNYWLSFRKETLQKEIKYDLNVAEARLNIVKGLIIVADDTDKIVKLAKASNGRQGFIDALLKYGLNQPQAENIAGLALYRLNKQDHAKLMETQNTLNKQIDEYNYNLNHLHEYLRKSLQESINDIKEDNSINTNRLTKLVGKVKDKKVNLNKLTVAAAGKPAYIAVMSNATALRMTPRVYSNNIEEAKEDKPIVKTLKAETTDWVLFLTDSGQVVTRLVNDLVEINPKYDVESFYKQISDLRTDEKFIDGEIFDEEIKKEKPYILSFTEMGLAKLSELEKSMPNTRTKRYLNHLTKYNGLKNDGDRVGIATMVTPADVKNKKIVVTMDNGKTWSYDLDKISIQAQTGSGARKVKPFEARKVQKFEIVDK